MNFERILGALDTLEAQRVPISFFVYISQHDGKIFYDTIGGLAHVAGVSDELLIKARAGNSQAFHELRDLMFCEYGIDAISASQIEHIHDIKFSTWADVRDFFLRKQKGST